MSGLQIVKDKYLWYEILKKFENIDCYYSFEYGKLFARIEKGDLLAAYFEGDNSKLFYPFIRRKIPNVEEEIYDIVTPYGYGGPLLEGAETAIIEFYRYFEEYCNLNNIVTETVRFHPLYKNFKLCKSIMNVEYIRKTASVDLTLPIDKIKNNYSTMNKRNIKKAKVNNISCFIAEKNKENIKTFIQIYNETMDRNQANNYYYFDEAYFMEQVKDTNISENILLFAKLDEEIVAGLIVMIGNEFGHYHLGASKTKHLKMKPNNLLFDFMIEVCKSKGLKTLHLGGGYEENDGLFNFKKSFSNELIHDYYLGKKVHKYDQYKVLVENLREDITKKNNFFPLYRA